MQISQKAGPAPELVRPFQADPPIHNRDDANCMVCGKVHEAQLESDPDHPVTYAAPILISALRAIGFLISKAFWFIRFQGRANIPSDAAGGFVMVANHQTYFDPGWICIPVFRYRFRFMAFDDAFGWPLVGAFIKYFGAFPVSADLAGSRKAIRDGVISLQDGAVLTIFPEGEREFENGKVLQFRTGAVAIALHANVPILPVTISGGNRIWPQGQRYPRLFRTIEVTYHPLFHATREPNVDAHENLLLSTSKLREIIYADVDTRRVRSSRNDEHRDSLDRTVEQA